jgi:hypothetical protein
MTKYRVSGCNLLIMIKNRKEALATFLGMDVAEIDDYRYHYGRTTKPVWAFTSSYYCVTKINEKPAKYRDDESKWEWVNMPDKLVLEFGYKIWKCSNE